MYEMTSNVSEDIDCAVDEAGSKGNVWSVHTAPDLRTIVLVENMYYEAISRVSTTITMIVISLDD